MTHLETQLLAKLRTLPTDKQREVLDFVEFLVTRANPQPISLSQAAPEASFARVAQQYIGVAEGPGDLSTNSDHMQGYGA